MYVKANGTTVLKFPYSYVDLRADHPDISFPQAPTDACVAEYGMFPVTQKNPPAHDYIQQVAESVAPVFNGTSKKWESAYSVRAASPEEVQSNKAAMIGLFDRALTEYLDSVAQSRRYDNRITCALRAGYPGPFQAEGQAFAAWMDTCNASAYQQLGEIQAGNQPMPVSVAAFIASLPEITWP